MSVPDSLFFRRAAFVLMAVLSLSSAAFAQSPVPSNAPTGFPTWWFTRNVIAPTNSISWPNIPNWPGDYSPSDDYSAINQGTLKSLASAAIAELQAQLPAAVLTNSNATALQNLISGWVTNPATSADPYAAVNQGQLKYLAKQFYDVLGSGSYTAGIGLQPTNWTSGVYPWSTNTGADPYSLANIGQAKYVFSFDLTAPPGQVPAWWAQYYFGTTNVNTGTLSPTGDGYTYLQEYQLGRNPIDAYNGSLPTLAIVSGNTQTGSPEGLVSLPLIVQVSDTSNNPVFNAPVVFSVTGGGLLQSSSVATPAVLLNALTDGSGQAKVYFQLPATTNHTSTITCTATSGSHTVSVSFSESSDNGNGSYASPFAPSSVVAILNPDQSMDITWVNNTDPSDTRSIPVVYSTTNATGNVTWVTATNVPAGTTYVHLLKQ